MTDFRDVVRRLLEECPTAFYVLTGRIFVGLEQKKVVAIDSMFKQFELHSSFLQFFESVATLEVRQYRTVADSCMQSVFFNLANGPDKKLKSVVKDCGSLAAKRFLENYCRALDDCILNPQHQLDEHNNSRTIVTDRGRNFEIVSESCGCLELEKTGVACCHLIKQAMLKNGSYSHLVAPFWKRTRDSSK